MSQNTDCKFMFLADLNCNIYDPTHCYTKLIHDLMVKHRLLSAFDLVQNFDYGSSFTRFDKKTNSYTSIDGILLSEELRFMVSNIRISNYGNNVSDHLPVELTLSTTIATNEPRVPKKEPFINWGKLSQHDLDLFEQKLTQNLNAIDIPSFAVFHGSRICLEDCHKVHIENYYNDIVTAIMNANLFYRKQIRVFTVLFGWKNCLTLNVPLLNVRISGKAAANHLTAPFFNVKKAAIIVIR